MANPRGATVTDLLVAPRHAVEESWMDVAAIVFSARQDLGRSYAAITAGRDPLPALFDADRRLIRLREYARRQAGAAAGITYIDANQLPLFEAALP